MKKGMRKITMKDVKDLFSEKLWSLDPNKFASDAWKKLVHFVKIVRTTFGSFAANKMGFQCVALSYFVTLAIIPFVAFIFFVSNGLKISDKVAEWITAALPNNLDLVNIAIEKANNIITSAQSGPVGIISAALFIWTIIWLMYQTECVFNNVWGVSKVPRKLYKRFAFYFGLLLLSPFVVIIMSYGIVLYTNAPSLIGVNVAFLHQFLGWLIFYAFVVLILSICYKFIPAAKVNYRYALNAACFDAIVFCLFQYLYLETQMFVTRLNSVYGVLAAIPLFLIWLNYSFQIILYGASLSYSLQHVAEMEKENIIPEVVK